MSRVLRPGGRLFVLDFSIPRFPGIRQLYLFYLKQIMPRIAGWITGKREAYVYLCGSIERFPSGKDMEELIRANGFQSATTTPLRPPIVARTHQAHQRVNSHRSPGVNARSWPIVTFIRPQISQILAASSHIWRANLALWIS